MRRPVSAFAFVSILLLPLAAHAMNYDESVSGDLSGNRLAPTPLALNAGSNTLRATSAAGDIEYYTVTLPPNHQLTAIRVLASNGNLSFIAVQQGTTFTEPPAANVANLLGYSHFGAGNGTVGTDILDDIGRGLGTIGFTGSLRQPPYTFWSQETSATPTTYQLELVVAPIPVVPLPSAVGPLLAAGLGLLGVGALVRRGRTARSAAGRA